MRFGGLVDMTMHAGRVATNRQLPPANKTDPPPVRVGGPMGWNLGLVYPAFFSSTSTSVGLTTVTLR